MFASGEKYLKKKNHRSPVKKKIFQENLGYFNQGYVGLWENIKNN